MTRRRGGDLRIDALWCLALTAVFEGLACLFHFGLRIHHVNAGLLLIVAAFFFRPGSWRRWCLIVGLALAPSDLAHHFLVLWPVTGHSDFDLTYPE